MEQRSLFGQSTADRRRFVGRTARSGKTIVSALPTPS